MDNHEDGAEKTNANRFVCNICKKNIQKKASMENTHKNPHWGETVHV